MPAPFVVVVPTDAIEFNEVYRNFTGSGGYFVANNIYSRLVLHGTKSPAVFPDLASHWEVLDNARRFRFQLDPAALWHDGEQVTAHDVAYSHLHAIENNYHASAFLTGVTGIEEIDEHTVEYTLEEPNSGFLTQLGNFAFTHILPAHLYEGTDWATNPYNLKPVGSGPFRFVEWVPGEHIVMERFDDYFGPRASMDQVIIKITPDREEALRLVSDGEAQYMVEEILTPDRLADFPPTEKAALHYEPTPSITFLGFNHEQERFTDERLRRALAHAMDRSLLEEMPGYGTSIRSFFPPILEWAYNPDSEVVDSDLAEAERLLDEVGLVRGEDGIRAHFEVRYLAMFDGFRGIASVIEKSLAAVGITITAVGLSSPDWTDQVTRGGQFDLLITGGNMLPDPEITASRFESTGKRNYHRYSSERTDAAYKAGRSTMDRASRAAAYRDLQQGWADETAIIPLYWGSIYMLRSRTHFGWSDQLDSRIPFWHWGRIREV